METKIIDRTSRERVCSLSPATKFCDATLHPAGGSEYRVPVTDAERDADDARSGEAGWFRATACVAGNRAPTSLRADLPAAIATPARKSFTAGAAEDLNVDGHRAAPNLSQSSGSERLGQAAFKGLKSDLRYERRAVAANVIRV